MRCEVQGEEGGGGHHRQMVIIIIMQLTVTYSDKVAFGN